MHTDFESSRLSEKERHFREFSIWPVFADFDTEGWLSNFKFDERRVAERLLTNFCYFNEQMTDALLKAALQSCFSALIDQEGPPIRSIREHAEKTAFVICEGEQPHVTDSGHIFARKLRDKIGVPERRIFRPEEALRNAPKFSHFIFIDDFTGSGNQFVETWHAEHIVGAQRLSFTKLSASAQSSFKYCCCIATSKARNKIAMEASAAVLHPAHLLTDTSCAISTSSRIWEGIDPVDAIKKVKGASTRAGYGAEDLSQDDWRGFHSLGLALAFNHGIPDASLPLYFSQRNGWKPLIARPDHA